MILTASGVSSLATSLEHWEWAEYVSCALVALGCTGEYIAEFTDLWTAGIKERKDRLAKRSTLLLIFALALELICLVKTNSISGMLIGSLSDKAGAADTKAQSAIDKSSLAETKADAAAITASGAQQKADAASASADAADKLAISATTNARNARREAADARQETAQLLKDSTALGQDLEREKKTVNELEKDLTPRVLYATSINGKLNFEPLKPFAGTTIFMESLLDAEPIRAAGSIEFITTSAGWKYGGRVNTGRPMADGVLIEYRFRDDRGWCAALFLKKFLNDNNWVVDIDFVRAPRPDEKPQHSATLDIAPNTLRVSVGLQPHPFFTAPEFKGLQELTKFEEDSENRERADCLSKSTP